jgi:hypothetical protein
MGDITSPRLFDKVGFKAPSTVKAKDQREIACQSLSKHSLVSGIALTTKPHR